MNRVSSRCPDSGTEAEGRTFELGLHQMSETTLCAERARSVYTGNPTRINWQALPRTCLEMCRTEGRRGEIHDARDRLDISGSSSPEPPGCMQGPDRGIAEVQGTESLHVDPQDRQ